MESKIERVSATKRRHNGGISAATHRARCCGALLAASMRHGGVRAFGINRAYAAALLCARASRQRLATTRANASPRYAAARRQHQRRAANGVSGIRRQIQQHARRSGARRRVAVWWRRGGGIKRRGALVASTRSKRGESNDNLSMENGGVAAVINEKR
jgi:hypothetical protein